MIHRFTRTVRDWSQNVRKIVMGRPAWSPEREYSYYRADRASVLRQRDRQVEFEREAYATGLQILRAMDLLDVHALRGLRVLDIGAGEALLSGALARCGAGEVWAVDAVPKQLWAAAERHGGGRHRFVVADSKQLPFNDGTFDLVTANLVLHHIEPLEDILGEILRVLRPGGRFCAFEPSPIVGALAHGDASENEAPVAPGRVVSAMRRVGFDTALSSYYWSRGGTGALRMLSPGYRVTGYRAGTGYVSDPVLSRSLETTEVPNLELDGGCTFAPLAREQLSTIRQAIDSVAPAGPGALSAWNVGPQDSSARSV